MIALSSGAALRGSPLSGGYAGAKATIRWLTSYAAAESARAGLGIRFVALLPQLTPATELGAAATAAYAARAGVDLAAHIESMGEILTPEHAGKAVTALLAGRADDHGAQHSNDAYVLTAAGLVPLPGSGS